MDPAQPDPAPSTDHVDPWLLDAHEQARRLGSDPETGLTSAELPTGWLASAQSARGRGDRARVAQGPGQFADPLIYLLLRPLSCRSSRGARGRERRAVEAIVIAAIVLANGILGYAQERSAERAVAALARMAAPSAHSCATAGSRRSRRTRSSRATSSSSRRVTRVGRRPALPRGLADGRGVVLTGESEPVLKGSAPWPERAAGRPGEHGVQRDCRLAWAGSGRGHGDRDGDRDGPDRGPAGHHDQGAHPAPARDRLRGAHARHRRHRHRPRRHRRHPAHLRDPHGNRPHRRPAARRVARGGRRARGPAGDPVGDPRPRRPAHGPAPGDRQEAVVGRDAGLGVGHRLGQDRDP